MSLNSANKIETNKYELEISVDGNTFKEAILAAYRKNVGKISIPGFRKGKAPKSVIEKYYGESFFYEDAINEAYPKAYSEAVTEAKIEPVDKADIEVTNVSNDGFTFKATVTVKPEVEVTVYKGIKAEKQEVVVTEADIDMEINRLRDKNARIINVEDRAAELGDTVVIDFEGFLDGIPFNGGKGENFNLKLGSGQFIPGFEDQIVGKNISEEFDVNVTFPEDYNAEELAGKPTVFKVKIHEIKANELPVVDDEFVKDVSEFDTLEALKEDYKAKLTASREKMVTEDFENKLIDAVIDGMKAEIPEVMVEQKIDEMTSQFEQRLQSQGLNLNTYLQYTGMELASFRKTFAEQADKQVKIRLALEKIAQLENIVVSDEELEDEFKKIAEAYHMPVEQIKIYIPAENLAKDVAVNKAIDVVRDSAVEIKPTAKKSAAKSGADSSKKVAEKETEAKPATKTTAKKPAAKKKAVEAAE